MRLFLRKAARLSSVFFLESPIPYCIAEKSTVFESEDVCAWVRHLVSVSFMIV